MSANPGHAPDRGYRLDIQGLRGLAVLLVVLDHVGVGVPGGYVGVDVFFVISGFVIFRLLIRERDGEGVSIGRFYGRRARRIIPALAATLIGGLVLAGVAMNPFDAQPFAVRTAMSAVGFVTNLFLYRHVGYFDDSAALNPFVHLWSLAVEEQFYLLVPLVVVGVGALSRRARRDLLPGALAVVAAFSFVTMAGLTQGWFTFGLQAPARFAYYLMPTRAWELAVGGLVACWSARRPEGAAARTARWLEPLALAVLALGVVIARGGPEFDGLELVLPVVATGALIVAGTADSPARRLLASRPAVAAGGISYAWYLWHWPLIAVANAQFGGSVAARSVAAVLALAPAIASTRWIETPMRTAPLVPAVAWRRSVGSLAVAALVAGVVWAGASSGWGLHAPPSWDAHPRPLYAGCIELNRDLDPSWSPEWCTWTSGRNGPDTGSHSDARQLVMVVGDAAADAVGEAMIDLGGPERFQVAVWGRAGCPFVDADIAAYPKCTRWQRDVRALIERLQPTAVLVANTGDDYVDPDSSTPLVGTDGEAISSVEEGRTVWRRAVRRMLTRVATVDRSVVLVSPVPDFGPRFPFDSFSLLRPHPQPPAITRAEATTQRLGTDRIERRVVDEVYNRTGRFPENPPRRVAIVDPADSLCTTMCRAARGSDWWYLGRRSPTSYGAARMSESLMQVVHFAILSSRTR